MSRIRSKDTRPEILVRSFLHKNGFRFRKNVASLPGKPDIVLPKYQSVILVHGCFWHQHKVCMKSRLPSTNLAYWKPKIEGNIKRDKKNIKHLKALGWKTIVVWECELKNIDRTISRIQKKLIQTLE